MLDTIKQLLILSGSVKKLIFPLRFMPSRMIIQLVSYDEDGKANIRQPSYTKEDGLVQVGEWFSMMNMLTSKTNGKTLDDQMKNIYRIACNFFLIVVSMLFQWVWIFLELLSMRHWLVFIKYFPTFQKENKLQKVQCVILTDGEAPTLKCHREVNRRWEEDPICRNFLYWTKFFYS
jgi:hypothetical protein